MAHPKYLFFSIIILAGCSVTNPAQTSNTPPPTPTPRYASCNTTQPAVQNQISFENVEPPTDNNINSLDLPGSPLEISGYIYQDLEKTTPIADTTIQINQPHHDPNLPPLTGTITANEEGFYEFTTVYDGSFTSTTNHIHLNITAPGHNPLITQLIIPGLADQNINFAPNTATSSTPECHLLAIYDHISPSYATFDFRLP